MKYRFSFNPGFDITPIDNPLGFEYGANTFGPRVENRTLDSIRQNLLNPKCKGPEIVYSIAMDIGEREDYEEIKRRNLLYGAVCYAKGRLGNEPVRSQGHIHAISKSCNSSTCELYEIWSGSAYIYMQESAEDNPGRCFAVKANEGDVVLVPPGFAHSTISADIKQNLSFGAWCVRDFGFEYDDVRAHGGLAYFPLVNNNEITFSPNNRYKPSDLVIKLPRVYKEFDITPGKSIYQQFKENPDKFLFVSNPDMARERWDNFVP